MTTMLNPYTCVPEEAIPCKMCPALVRQSQETCSLDCWYAYQQVLNAEALQWCRDEIKRINNR